MGLAVRCVFAVLGALLLVRSAQAQFLEPDSDVDDLKQQWTVGQTINIAWKGWDTLQGGSERPDNCDLWITTFRDSAIGEVILANVKLDRAGSFDWKINLTNAQVSRDPQFVLRFVEHVDSNPPEYPLTSPMMPSRGFYIFPAGASSSSSTSNPTPTPSASATSSIISSGSASATPSSSETTTPESMDSSTESGSSNTTGETKKKSNTAAIAGGVVGGLVALAAILVGVLFLLRRAKQKQKAAAAYGPPQEKGVMVYAHEMETSPVEIGGASDAPPIELQGSPPA